MHLVFMLRKSPSLICWSMVHCYFIHNMLGERFSCIHEPLMMLLSNGDRLYTILMNLQNWWRLGKDWRTGLFIMKISTWEIPTKDQLQRYVWWWCMNPLFLTWLTLTTFIYWPAIFFIGRTFWYTGKDCGCNWLLQGWDREATEGSKHLVFFRVF